MEQAAHRENTHHCALVLFKLRAPLLPPANGDNGRFDRLYQKHSERWASGLFYAFSFQSNPVYLHTETGKVYLQSKQPPCTQLYKYNNI
jgi:hypothetical protein